MIETSSECEAAAGRRSSPAKNCVVNKGAADVCGLLHLATITRLAILCTAGAFVNTQLEEMSDWLAEGMRVSPAACSS